MAGNVEIIKSNGASNRLISKYEGDTFYTGAQLIVHESEEALFFKNGQALDLFGPGKHTLTSQSLPLLTRLFNRPANKNEEFQCEIFFINKTEQMGILWGTDSHVMYLDPNFNNYPFEIGASGAMSLSVRDSRKLLIKLVGNASGIDRLTLTSYIKPIIMMKVKSYIPVVLKKKAAPVYDITQYMEEFSGELRALIDAELDEYGVSIPGFWMTKLVLPEDDETYKKIVRLRGSSVTDVTEAMLEAQVSEIRARGKARETLIESEALAQKRAQEGYTKQWEDSAEAAKLVAQSQAASGLAGAGIGKGLMGGVETGIGAAVADMAASVMNANEVKAPEAPEAGMAEFKAKADKLRYMLDNDLIDEAEFKRLKQELLESL